MQGRETSAYQACFDFMKLPPQAIDHTTPLYQNREWLSAQVADGKTNTQIAALCGCRQMTVSIMRRAFSIPKHSKRVKHICKQCGNKFVATPASKRKYCSPECFCKNKSQINSIERTCRQCGNKFVATPSKTKNNRGKYCSKLCFYKSMSIRIERTCRQCGNKFVATPSKTKNNRGRYCSRKCSGAAHTGPGNPGWLGGKSFKPYPQTFNDAFKRMIRERDGYTCAICHLDGNSVHHINYIKDDTVPENCVTLCKSCHGKTNTQRAYWTVVLATIMQYRCLRERKTT